MSGCTLNSGCRLAWGHFGGCRYDDPRRERTVNDMRLRAQAFSADAEAENARLVTDLATLRAQSEAAADATLALTEEHARVCRERDTLRAALRVSATSAAIILDWVLAQSKHSPELHAIEPHVRELLTNAEARR